MEDQKWVVFAEASKKMKLPRSAWRTGRNKSVAPPEVFEEKFGNIGERKERQKAEDIAKQATLAQQEKVLLEIVQDRDVTLPRASDKPLLV